MWQSKNNLYYFVYITDLAGILRRSFQQIRKAKPTQLFKTNQNFSEIFLAADGPKNKKDKVNCQKIETGFC